MTDESKADIERLYRLAAPRAAPAELKAGILAAVADDLDRHRTGRPAWQTWIGRAVAASVLFSTATFAGVSWHEARRMAQWDRGRVVRSDVAELTDTIASVTDDESARAVEGYLISQLQTAAHSASATIQRDTEEIQRWSEGEPLAERSDSDVKTEDRI
jgi:hypothetical protein